MSLCLQSIVDEILRIKQGKPVKRPKDRSKAKNAAAPDFQRNNSISSEASAEGDTDQESKVVNSKNNNSTSPSTSPPTSPGRKVASRQAKTQVTKQKLPPATNGAAMTTNEVFEGIGDDDL